MFDYVVLSSYLRGGTALEFQRRTLGHGITPSEDTLRSYITEVIGLRLQDCGFTDARFNHVLPYYHALGYTSDVFLLVNDATAVLPALGYRGSDDTVHGLAISDDDLAKLDVRAGESLEDFLHRFHSYKLATQVEIVLLVPLKPRCPPYIVAAFAQSGSQTMETVQRRLAIAQEQMERRGALIIGWAADGASAHFKLMRQSFEVSPGSPVIEFACPTLQSTRSVVRIAARCTVWCGTERLVPATPLLDPVHLINLLRNAPLRKSATLHIGNADVDLALVRDFLTSRLSAVAMEAVLGVRLADFFVADRMNFAAAQRLFSTSVLTYLEEHCKEANFKGACLHTNNGLTLIGALLFFRVCNRVLRSYLDPQLNPCQRIEFAFYAMFVLQAWYTQLKNEHASRKKALSDDAAMAIAEISSSHNCTKKVAAAIYKEQTSKKRSSGTFTLARPGLNRTSTSQSGITIRHKNRCCWSALQRTLPPCIHAHPHSLP